MTKLSTITGRFLASKGYVERHYRTSTIDSNGTAFKFHGQPKRSLDIFCVHGGI